VFKHLLVIFLIENTYRHHLNLLFGKVPQFRNLLIQDNFSSQLKNSMVVGIDTYHERKARSVGGFVASLNGPYTRYYSKATVFEAKQEIQDHLKVMMTGVYFQQENPER
jgi:hypothetical protein